MAKRRQNPIKTLCEKIESMDKHGSENDQTTQTWLPWFRQTLKAKVHFDTSSRRSKNRPDLQIWKNENQKRVQSHAPLWLEAKPFNSFKNNSELTKAVNESIQKIQDEYKSGRATTPGLIISDFTKVYYWKKTEIAKRLEKGNDIGRPSGQFIFANLNAEKASRFLAFIDQSFEVQENEQVTINLKEFTEELLHVTRDFQENVLPRISTTKTRFKKTFDTWKLHTGTETLAMFARDDSIDDQGTFAELCFHTLIVRIFGIKWCIDQGYLSGTKLERDWQALYGANNSTEWLNVLVPSGKSETEKLLKKVFEPTNMYMWVIDELPKDLLESLYISFRRQKIVAPETDILGEFYQNYISLYSKKAQFELGQFYTPHKLVRAMWHLVEQTLRIGKKSISDKNVVTVDPSAGTGTFLTQGLRLAISGGWSDRTRKIPSSNLKDFIKIFSGLEVNPFSKGVADVNYLTEIFSHAQNVKASDIPIPSIFETNSYSINQTPIKSITETDKDIRAWQDRWEESCRAKQDSKYRVVIGNPPWNTNSLAMKDEKLKKIIQEKLIPWAYEYDGENLSDKRGCNHGIRDEYMFFYGVAEKLVGRSGLICFVTNESWLMATTYRLARRYFTDNFKIHNIIRLGPYFRGVQEKACVVIMEKTKQSSRNQKIKFLDWSDSNNDVWSYNWINHNLDRLILNKVKKGEWKEISPAGEDCVLIPLDTDLIGLESTSYLIEEIFEEVTPGAEPGYTPLFIDSSRDELIGNMRHLFSNSPASLKKLALQFAPSTRGGPKKAKYLISRVANQINADSQIKFLPKNIRSVMVYDEEKKATNILKCYFDPKLWWRPRCNRDAKGESIIWNAPLKLAYRDFSDAGKVPKSIGAISDSKKLVITKHSMNGGCNIIAFKSQPSLTKAFLGKLNLSAVEWHYYLLGILNSRYAVEYGKKNPRQKLKIPVSPVFQSEMKQVSRLAKQYKSALQSRALGTVSNKDEVQLKKFDHQISLLFARMKNKTIIPKLRKKHLDIITNIEKALVAEKKKRQKQKAS